MSESFRQHKEHSPKPTLPEVIRPSLIVLDALRQVELYPADRTDLPNLVDPYGAKATLEANSDEVNPGRFFMLDQYLAAEVLLRPLLDGAGRLITSHDPEYPDQANYQHQYIQVDPLRFEPDYQELAEELELIKHIPQDIPKNIGRLGEIINRSYQALIFKAGLSAKENEWLQYPVGIKLVPQLLSIVYGSEELPARIFMHRALQNQVALENLLDPTLAETEEALNSETHQTEQVTLPIDHLKAETVSWAEYLKNGWTEASEDRKVSVLRDATGLPIETSVKGWAQLELDYDFVDLARRKLSLLVEYLMKVMANAGKDVVELEEELSIEFLLGDLNDSFNRDERNNWTAQIFVPEYRLITDLFYETFKYTLLVQSAVPDQIPGDMHHDVVWLQQVINNPQVVEMYPGGKEVLEMNGIMTDIPSADVVDQAMHMDDGLELGSNDVITARQKYHLYVHPLIWDKIRSSLGSNLILSYNN